jgi:hypothetical protein
LCFFFAVVEPVFDSSLAEPLLPVIAPDEPVLVPLSLAPDMEPEEPVLELSLLPDVPVPPIVEDFED